MKVFLAILAIAFVGISKSTEKRVYFHREYITCFNFLVSVDCGPVSQRGIIKQFKVQAILNVNCSIRTLKEQEISDVKK